MVPPMQARLSQVVSRSAFVLGLLSAALTFTVGCSSDSSTSAPEEEVSREREVSSVPWNKPANWEGGSVGGVNPGL